MAADWLKKEKKPDDMDVTPNPSANPNDAGTAIPKGRRTEVIMRLQSELKPDLFTPQGAFDGKANLFSTKEYAFATASQKFEVPWSSSAPRGGNAGAGGGAGGVRKQRVVTVTITKVADIDRRYIQEMVQGDPESVKQGSGAMMTLNMLNVFVQAAPRMQPRTLYNARSFYVPNDRAATRPFSLFSKLTSVIGAPQVNAFEIWKGYYQSVRPTFDKLVVTIDQTVGVVVPQKRLLDLFMNYAGFRDTRRISELTKNDPAFRSLRVFAKQLKFTVDLPGHRGGKPKLIADLIPDSGAVTFDKHGEEVTVA
ncbi:hypothetical protein AX14_006717, partial [Amanita brunnescens Koide BX004]